MCLKEIKNEEKAGMTHTHGFNIATLGTLNSGLRGYTKICRNWSLLSYNRSIMTKSITYNSNINQLALPLVAEVRFNAALSYLVESNDKNALKSALSRQEILNISEEEAIYLFDTWIKVREPNIEPKARFPWDDRERNVVLPMIVRLCIGLILTEYS